MKNINEQEELVSALWNFAIIFLIMCSYALIREFTKLK